MNSRAQTYDHLFKNPMIQKLSTTILLICLIFPNINSQTIKHRFLACGSGMKNIVIVDAEGEIEWQYPGGKECNDVSMLSDGTILFSERTGAKLVNLDKEILWEYVGEKGTEVQSASPLKNGNFLIVQNGNPAKLMEINRQGKIKFEMNLPTKITKIHRQFRNIRKTQKGTYLVGYFGENKVCEFNNKGEIINTIPNTGNSFVAVRLPNGNTLIACGDAHRLIEVNKENEEVWSVKENEIPGHPMRFVAGVQRLPNGNTIICNWGGHGHKEQQAQIIEITRDKKVVWEVRDWTKFKTISSVQLLDVKGKMEKGQLLR